MQLIKYVYITVIILFFLACHGKKNEYRNGSEQKQLSLKTVDSYLNKKYEGVALSDRVLSGNTIVKNKLLYYLSVDDSLNKLRLNIYELEEKKKLARIELPNELFSTTFYVYNRDSVYFLNPTTGELFLFNRLTNKFINIDQFPFAVNVIGWNNLLLLESIKGVYIYDLYKKQKKLIGHNKFVDLNANLKVSLNDDKLYVSGVLDSTISTEVQLVFYDLNNFSKPGWIIPIENKQTHKFLVQNNNVYILTSPFNDLGYKISSFSESGSILGELKEENTITDIIVHKDSLFYSTFNKIICMSSDMKDKKWETNINGGIKQLRATKNILYVVNENDQKSSLFLINQTTGKIIDEFQIEFPFEFIGDDFILYDSTLYSNYN